MTRSAAFLALGITAVYITPAVNAHDGEAHRDADAPPVAEVAVPLAAVPHKLSNGDLFVPKAVQHLLGVRTETLAQGRVTTALKLQGEVIARPEARTLIAAPETGILEAPEGDWPLAGVAVKAGQVLAYLRPQITQRDAAKRTAQRVESEQRALIDQINVERLRLQSSASEGQASGNVYYEQALAELEAATQQRDQAAASLTDRLPLRAAVSGVLLRSNLREGEMVIAGQPLFEVTNPAQLRVAAYSFDPRLAAKVQSAHIAVDTQRQVPLRLRAQEPLKEQSGWRLLLDVADAGAGLVPGMPVDVVVDVDADAATQQLSKACVTGLNEGGGVWVHVAPERFALRRIAACDAVNPSVAAIGNGTVSGFKPGDRLVVVGGALLAQYQ